jgi:hypothetical protein
MSLSIDDIINKIKSFQTDHGKTDIEMSKMLGFSKPSGYYAFLKTKNTNINRLVFFINESGIDPSKIFNVSNILYESGDRKEEINISPVIPGNLLESQPDLKWIPYWDLEVSAGHSLKDVIGKNSPDGYISGLPGSEYAENILPVSGTSMEPEITSGALIGVKRMNNWETLNTERVYLIITKEDRMIKRIEHDNENSGILWCLSPNYPKFKIYKEDVIEIHRICFVYNAK